MTERGTTRLRIGKNEYNLARSRGPGWSLADRQPLVTGCGKLASGFPCPSCPPCFVFEFDPPGLFESIGGPLLVIADEIRLLADNPVESIDALGTFNIRGANIAPIVITEEGVD